jgi:hypothetical protein
MNGECTILRALSNEMNACSLSTGTEVDTHDAFAVTYHPNQNYLMSV